MQDNQSYFVKNVPLRRFGTGHTSRPRMPASLVTLGRTSLCFMHGRSSHDSSSASAWLVMNHHSRDCAPVLGAGAESPDTKCQSVGFQVEMRSPEEQLLAQGVSPYRSVSGSGSEDEPSLAVRPHPGMC